MTVTSWYDTSKGTTASSQHTAQQIRKDMIEIVPMKSITNTQYLISIYCMNFAAA
jgi:hypothetical protein